MYHHKSSRIYVLGSNHTLVISFLIVLLNIVYILWQTHIRVEKVMRSYLKENLQR